MLTPPKSNQPTPTKMEQTTPYRYEALNDGSYNELAAYAINLVGNVSLFPAQHTIVIDGKFSNDVGKFIDQQGLDFHCNPIEVHDENIGEIIDNGTTDPDTLRNIIYRLLEQKSHMAEQHETVIAEIAKERDNAKKDRDMYMRWYSDSNSRSNRIKGQVQAIALLMSEIFPEE